MQRFAAYTNYGHITGSSEVNTLFLAVIAGFLWLTPAHADQAKNIAVATAMVEAINNRNLDALDKLIAPDVVRRSAATAGVTVDSLDDFKAFLEADFSTVPDSVMSIDLIFGTDEFVAMRAVYSGTQTEQMGQMPPSGKHFDLPPRPTG